MTRQNGQNGRYTRQSFLGADAEARIARCIVGVAGLGGGGSHIVQQLAHIGFQNYVLYDNDTVEESNLNRLIGGRTIDVAAATSKLHIAKMMILGLQPDASIASFPCRWQEEPASLQRCHLIFGCVDSYAERDELEKLARRYLINYVDIGMDVTIGADSRPVVGGQVILSAPGHPCMWCMGFLTDDLLGEEAQRYGAAGDRPQVVWPNGVLASTAVGIGVDLVTDWTQSLRGPVYLEYDGNRGTMRPHWQLRKLPGAECPHYPINQIGPPKFQVL